MPGEVTVDDVGSVRILTLRNPDKRNALDPAMCASIARAIASFAGDGVRAAVVTGEGDRAFSAGFDLDRLSGREPAGETPETGFDAMIEAVAASPVPIVAALNGVALGGGCELAITCDVRVAHDGVKLAMPPARLGIVYAPRGLARFTAIAGESRARRMFLFGHTASAREALAWGLIDELVPVADVHTHALALASQAAELAPLAVRGMRRAFEALLARRASLEGADAQEIAALRAAAWRSDDAAEALRAFLEKRKPVFRGA